MRRETGVTHDLHCSNIRLQNQGCMRKEGGCGGGGFSQATLLILLSSFPFQEMISGDPALPRLSLKIIFNTIDDIHRVQPSLTSPRKDDPRGQRKQHRVITSKSQRRAYVKPETIGSLRRSEAGRGPRLSATPLSSTLLPHKKKINSVDYQASIKCLLLSVAGIPQCL